MIKTIVSGTFGLFCILDIRKINQIAKNSCELPTCFFNDPAVKMNKEIGGFG